MIIPSINTSVKLIGITGKAGVGKSTVATYLHTKYPCTYTISFADALKESAAKLYGIPVEYFYDPDYKEVVIPYWGKSPRHMAQEFGTEIIREYLGKDFWIQRVAAVLDNAIPDGAVYDEDDTVVIPDVRFQNEADFIIRNGGILIEIRRPGYEGTVGIAGHASEQGGLEAPPEVFYLINNTGTEKELYEEVDKIVKPLYPMLDESKY